jgi:hypothetical protein
MASSHQIQAHPAILMLSDPANVEAGRIATGNENAMKIVTAKRTQVAITNI